MSASPEIETVGASSLDEAYGYALAKVVPVVSERGEGGDVLLFLGEGESPDAALADAVDAIRDLVETHGGEPGQVVLDGSLRTDAGYRLWGTITLGGGKTMDAPATAVRIEQGEEGTWTVTITRS